MSKTEAAATSAKKTPLKGEDREKVVGSIIRAIFRRISPAIREGAEAVTSGEGADGVASKVSGEVKRLLGQVKEIPGGRGDLSEELRGASGPITDDDFKHAKVLRDSGASFSQIGMELATDPVALNTRFLHGTSPKPKKEKAVKAPKAKRERKSGRAKKAEAPKADAAKPTPAPVVPASKEKDKPLVAPEEAAKMPW